MVTIRRLSVEDWPTWRELRLAALGEAPYAFGSKLADWQGDGDRAERWRDRLLAAGINAIAELDGVAAGMVSGVASGAEVELISLWVAPRARGHAVGDALVQAVLDWARAQGAASVALEVREGNAHAEALYRRHGFVDQGRVAAPEDDEAAERRMIRALRDTCP